MILHQFLKDVIRQTKVTIYLLALYFLRNDFYSYEFIIYQAQTVKIFCRFPQKQYYPTCPSKNEWRWDYMLNKGNKFRLILMDFSKAFDILNHIFPCNRTVYGFD